ncbi:ATP-binding protein [Clostridium drakei]|uniref:histidine kinase n=1 Tax=Clostridium drakei TaxID=332101 RepID=A0A2U8DYU8_9CLOT|nr:ATP-binding protein [Clostridium drakei]AWI07252.1 ATP-binding protein [Clostridium drakei]
MKKLKRTLTVVIGVVVASQIYFGFLIQDFTIALSAIIFSVFLYNYTELNPIVTAIVTGVSTTLYRSVWIYCSNMDIMKTIKITTPEIMFYATFGCLFYFLYYRSKNKDLTKFILSVFWCDFISNVVEISIRTRTNGENSNMIKALLIVACVRTLVTLIILMLMKYYKSFLVKEEHEERYRKLILLTSSFKSEIYFMNKNAAEIEDVMKKSFSAYEIVSKNNYPGELKNLTLDIAKDIHEIKKDYIRVMRGLEEMSNEKIDVEHMKIKDVISILEIYTKDYIVVKKLNIELDFKVECNFYVSQHFYLVSIIRNLIFNGIEAIDNKEKGLIKLRIEKQECEYIFIVTDNGTGINDGNLDFIFNPGFSTKYDKSGSICRGIGLTLVKDLVQDIFKGSIYVESVENEGTTFTVKIPTSSFRG